MNNYEDYLGCSGHSLEFIEDDFDTSGQVITKHWKDLAPVLWKTRDGQEMRIEDMTDSHLKNAVNRLRNRKHPHFEGTRGYLRRDDMVRFQCLCQEMAYRGLSLP